MGLVGCGGRLGFFSFAGPALKPFDAGIARAFARGITCSSSSSRKQHRERMQNWDQRLAFPAKFDANEAMTVMMVVRRVYSCTRAWQLWQKET
jgi:hypothetical protein